MAGYGQQRGYGKMQLTMTRTKNGFTIVELIVVVIVIAILAAVTLVAYNGVQENAANASVKADVDNAMSQLATDYQKNGFYPDSQAEVADGAGFTVSSGNSIAYVKSGDWFCVQVSSNREGVASAHHVSTGTKIEDGDCPTAPLPTTMQAFSPANCQSLTTFTGSNASAVISLKDGRGGITRMYDVAKLADGNCWMLTNLKLGSATSSITLRATDSDVDSGFVLPPLSAPAIIDYDLPQVLGPIPGDTGSGSTNYGYLYNFAAATAGESRESLPEGAGDAPHSICPRGWTLPSGGMGEGDFARLDRAFGGTGVTVNNGPSFPIWSGATSPIKPVWSGHRSTVYAGQTLSFDLWTRTAAPGLATDAYGAGVGFTSLNVRPGDFATPRSYGRTVRCVVVMPLPDEPEGTENGEE